MAGLPFLEAIRAGADRIAHRASARIRVFLDDLAGHCAQRRVVENLEQRVVGLDQLQPERVAIGRAQALHFRVVVESSGRFRFGDRFVEPDDLVLEQIRVGRAHARIDDAFPRVGEIRRGQLALLASEGRVVGEVDPLPDADRPDATVRGDLGQAGRDARHELERPREIVPLVERVENPCLDDSRVGLLGAGRIESRHIGWKGDPENLRGIGPIGRDALRREWSDGQRKERDYGRPHRHRRFSRERHILSSSIPGLVDTGYGAHEYRARVQVSAFAYRPLGRGKAVTSNQSGGQ